MSVRVRVRTIERHGVERFRHRIIVALRKTVAFFFDADAAVRRTFPYN